MKKIMLCSIIIMSILILCLYYAQNSNKKIYKNTVNSSHVINQNNLTMMYETEAGSGEYQVTSDTTWPQDGYIFNEALSKCENGSKLTWDDENKRVIMQANISDKCYVYFDIQSFANYIINNVYTGNDGDNDLYYHAGVGTYPNADQEAGDNSYRFSGANPNNYVCFGSDVMPCPENNLYRIIGVFDNSEVKLIKSSELIYSGWGDYQNYYWGDSYINESLNTTFVNSFTDEWQSKILEKEWIVGGNTRDNIVNSNVKNAYFYELINYNTSGEYLYTDKIGLIYISDYTYATIPDNWTIIINNYSPSISDNNWMYMTSKREWTITRASNISDVFLVGNDDSITKSGVDIAVSALAGDLTNNAYARPTFYLIPNVIYISGTGTQTDPYRIA